MKIYDDTYTVSYIHTHIITYIYVCVCVIMSEHYLVDLGRFDRSYCWLSNIAKKPSWDLLVPRPSSRRVWCSSLPRRGRKKGVAPLRRWMVSWKILLKYGGFMMIYDGYPPKRKFRIFRKPPHIQRLSKDIQRLVVKPLENLFWYDFLSTG